MNRRIGFLVKDLRINGANRIILELAHEFGQLGYSVSLFLRSFEYPAWLYHSHLGMEHMGEAQKFGASAWISTFYKTLPDLMKLDAPLKMQLIMADYHTCGDRRVDHDQIEACYRYRGGTNIAVSSYVASVLAARDTPSIVVNPGVRHSQFFYDPAWRSDRFRVLIEGSLRSYKVVPDAYAAVPPEFEIWGLGQEDHCERANKMWITPEQNDLRRIYSACDVLVKLVRKEGFPLPILEAMACGLVVICANEGGHLDYCRHLENCIVVNSVDEVGTWLHKIKNDSRLRTSISAAALVTSARFGWPLAAKKISALISAP